jgi:hypothetical protein
VVLSRREREGYLRVHAQAARLWGQVKALPPAAINQRLLQIMSLLLPLRRCAPRRRRRRVLRAACCARGARDGLPVACWPHTQS